MIFTELTCQNLRKNYNIALNHSKLIAEIGLVRRMDGNRSERETRQGVEERSMTMHYTCITLPRNNLINKKSRNFLEQYSELSEGSAAMVMAVAGDLLEKHSPS